MAAHAKLSPSSAERWMTCPGSVVLSESIEDKGSTYADEGTAAHFLAEQCLTTGDHPVGYIGKSVFVGDETGFEDDGSGTAEFIIDSDFAAAVNQYVQYVRDVVKHTNGELHVEQRLDISFLTGEEDAEGTSDTVILTPDELIVIDLKFGQGVSVDADSNKQLMIYGLAALNRFGLVYDFKQVRLVIHQPRTNHVSEWVISVEELEEFAIEVRMAADRVWRIQAVNPDTDCKVSEKGCQWCRAKATCPALDRFVQDAIEADFEDLTEAPAVAHDTEKLAAKMKACNIIEDWIKAVRGAVEAELFSGNQVPGYKIVQGKRGNRQWNDPAVAEQTLKSMKIKEADMYDFKLISPTSADKLAKAGTIGPRQWPKLEALIVQPEGKPSVAPESDKRPALVIGKVEDDFEDLTPPDLI